MAARRNPLASCHGRSALGDVAVRYAPGPGGARGSSPACHSERPPVTRLRTPRPLPPHPPLAPRRHAPRHYPFRLPQCARSHRTALPDELSDSPDRACGGRGCSEGGRGGDFSADHHGYSHHGYGYSHHGYSPRRDRGRRGKGRRWTRNEPPPQRGSLRVFATWGRGRRRRRGRRRKRCCTCGGGALEYRHLPCRWQSEQRQRGR